jgi:predicted ATP-grasp superfamily ATP-dependent carboligase
LSTRDLRLCFVEMPKNIPNRPILLWRTSNTDTQHQIYHTSKPIILSMSRVGIHRAKFADFLSDLWHYYSQSHLYIGFANLYWFVKSI